MLADETVFLAMLSALATAGTITAVWYMGSLLGLFPAGVAAALDASVVDQLVRFGLSLLPFLDAALVDALVAVVAVVRHVLLSCLSALLLLLSLALLARAGVSVHVLPMPRAGRRCLDLVWRALTSYLDWAISRPWLFPLSHSPAPAPRRPVTPRVVHPRRYSASASRSFFAKRAAALSNWRAGRFREWAMNNIRGQVLSMTRHRLVVLSHRHVVRVFHPSSGELLFTVPCEQRPLAAAASRDFLLLGYFDSQGVRVFDLRSRGGVFYGGTRLGIDGAVPSLLTPLGRRFGCADLAGVVTVWEMPDGDDPLDRIQRVAQFAHPSSVRCMAMCPPCADHHRDELLVTSCRSAESPVGAIYVWNMRTHESRVIPFAHTSGPASHLCPITSVSHPPFEPLHAEPPQGAAANSDDLLILPSVTTPRRRRVRASRELFCHGQFFLSAAESDPHVQLWDATTGTRTLTARLHDEGIAFVDMNHDMVVSISSHGRLAVHQLSFQHGGARLEMLWHADLGMTSLAARQCLMDDFGMLCNVGTCAHFLDFTLRADKRAVDEADVLDVDPGSGDFARASQGEVIEWVPRVDHKRKSWFKVLLSAAVPSLYLGHHWLTVRRVL